MKGFIVLLGIATAPRLVPLQPLLNRIPRTNPGEELIINFIQLKPWLVR